MRFRGVWSWMRSVFHIHLEVIMNCVGCMKVLTKDLMKVKSERYGFTSSALWWSSSAHLPSLWIICFFPFPTQILSLSLNTTQCGFVLNFDLHLPFRGDNLCVLKVLFCQPLSLEWTEISPGTGDWRSVLPSERSFQLNPCSVSPTLGVITSVLEEN